MQATDSDLDIMATLKSRTALQHASIERVMPFFDESLTLETYAQTLGAFLGFYVPVESRLAELFASETLGIDLVRRRRTHLLRQDLHALGISESAIAALPNCDNLPKLENPSSGLGCLYVLEGSTLGGQPISRELARRFRIDETSGASFFCSYGADVGAMWTQFCSIVRKHADDPTKRAAVVNAAIDTFSSFENWMRKVDSNG